ncbi:MAG: phosphoribosylglycinamide formyltransferase [Blastochloris sp.]|nr:phosphoribosylglycinamide formyltransferase [Blastochloris sp.]
MTRTLQLGILGSGRGSNFQAIHRAILSAHLPARIALVASDLAQAPILDYARSHQLPTYACPPSRFKTKLEPELEQTLAAQLQQSGAELIVLAGFMRVIKEPLLRAFPGRILNIHPSLLPSFKGLAAWKQALDARVDITGCTVHWVDDSLDGGPIIRQAQVPVLPQDSPESLHQRIQEQEHLLLPSVLHDIATGKIPLPE